MLSNVILSICFLDSHGRQTSLRVTKKQMRENLYTFLKYNPKRYNSVIFSA